MCKKSSNFATDLAKNNILYCFCAYVRHFFTSWNTGGEGIHSPYLFHLVRFIVADDNRYYSWREIEQRREAMLRAPKLIDIADFGTGQSRQTLVSEVAKTSLTPRQDAQILYRIVNWLSHEAGRPLNIVELGTNLGITTAYLAMPDSRNTVTTYEGSHALVEMAQLNWNKLNIKNIRVVEGNIDETLNRPTTNDQRPTTIDIAYIDANHTYDATLRYFETLQSRSHEKTIIVLDDIHHSPEMERAWKAIQQNKEVTSTMDFFDFGLVFFDPHYLRKNYRLRK